MAPLSQDREQFNKMLALKLGQAQLGLTLILLELLLWTPLIALHGSGVELKTIIQLLKATLYLALMVLLPTTQSTKVLLEIAGSSLA